MNDDKFYSQDTEKELPNEDIEHDAQSEQADVKDNNESNCHSCHHTSENKI